MGVVQTLIGNVKGPKGDTGATGATGASGAAATISVGTVSTTAYGNPAQVTNSGTSSAAVFDFVIPQGAPGEEVTDMSGLVLGTMTTQTSEFPTPAVNDTGAVLWGKVVKYFSDLRTLIGTKLAAANVVNNLTTTESGYALDARQGKAINDKYSALFKFGTYSTSVTVAANTGKNITRDELGISAVDSYIPVAFRSVNSDNTGIVIAGLRPHNIGSGENAVISIRNVTGSSISANVYCIITFMRRDAYGGSVTD